MTNKKSSSHPFTIGAGLAALAAAAAGAYFLYGSKDAKKNRRKVKSWMLKMKAEVMDKIEEAQDLTEDKYHDIVETVAAKYRVLKDVDTKEVSDLADRMRAHWADIREDLSDAAHIAKERIEEAAKAESK